MAEENKEKIIFEIEVDEKDADKAVKDLTISLASLTEANKKLREERKNLNLATEEGKKRVLEINQVLDQNNKIIKENSSSLEQQRLNVGNYTRSILDAVPGIKGFREGINGIGLAFKANPIGLAVTAFMALKGVFEANAQVADQLAFAFDGLKKGFTFIIDTIVNTVTSFDNLTAAITSPLQFLKNLASGTMDAAKAGYEAASAIDAFTVEQAKQNAAIQEANLQITALEKTLKDKTKSEQERIKIANQIADMEIQNSNRKKALAEQELANEELRLKDKVKSGDEEAKLIELESAVRMAAAEANIAAQQRQTRINILLAKEEVAGKKEAADELKQIEKDIAEARAASKQEDQMAKELENVTNLNGQLRESLDLKLMEIELTDESVAANEDLARSLKQVSDIRKEQTRNEQFYGQAAQQGLSIAGQLFSKNKAASSALALFSTLLSAQKAYESQFLPIPDPSSPIRGGIAAGIALAQGLARVGQINGVQGFASGGLTGKRITAGDGVPISRSNGDNLLATVRTGEVILNERQQAALGGSATFARIGVPGFANGGVVAPFETQFISNQVSSEAVLRSITRAITNQPQKVAIIEEIQALNTQTVQIKEMATI